MLLNDNGNIYIRAIISIVCVLQCYSKYFIILSSLFLKLALWGIIFNILKMRKMKLTYSKSVVIGSYLEIDQIKTYIWSEEPIVCQFFKDYPERTCSESLFSIIILIVHICKLFLCPVKVLVAQSCLTLCNPMDCSPPGSSVHGIL